MVSGPARYSIDEGFRQLTAVESLGAFPSRPEFRDPVVDAFQSVALSRLIDQELERFYNPRIELSSRVFRRFRAE